MWWLLFGIIAISVALLAGAMIRVGNPWNEEDDYMMGDDDPDWGDKS